MNQILEYAKIIGLALLLIGAASALVTLMFFGVLRGAMAIDDFVERRRRARINRTSK